MQVLLNTKLLTTWATWSCCLLIPITMRCLSPSPKVIAKYKIWEKTLLYKILWWLNKYFYLFGIYICVWLVQVLLMSITFFPTAKSWTRNWSCIRWSPNWMVIPTIGNHIEKYKHAKTLLRNKSNWNNKNVSGLLVPSQHFLHCCVCIL